MARTLVLHGPLDLAHAAELRPLLHQASVAGDLELVVDLSGVTRIDGTGLGMLAAARQRVRQRGGSFRVAGARPEVAGIMSAARVLTLLSGADDAAARVAALSSRRRPLLGTWAR